MTLGVVRLTRPARRQLQVILKESEASFGTAARVRYQLLVLQAFEDLLDDPTRSGVRVNDNRLHYHLRHSRKRVRGARVANPRHMIVARVVNGDLLVLAIVHDGMEQTASARIEAGERDLS